MFSFVIAIPPRGGQPGTPGIARFPKKAYVAPQFVTINPLDRAMVRDRGANVAGLVGLPRRWPGGALATRAQAGVARSECVAFRNDAARARLRWQGLGRRARATHCARFCSSKVRPRRALERESHCTRHARTRITRRSCCCRAASRAFGSSLVIGICLARCVASLARDFRLSRCPRCLRRSPWARRSCARGASACVWRSTRWRREVFRGFDA